MDAADNEPKHENGTDLNSDEGLQPIEYFWTSADDLEEEVSDLPLERCMRLVPHDQNSGAFFIAVLQKVSLLPGNNTGTACYFYRFISLRFWLYHY